MFRFIIITSNAFGTELVQTAYDFGAFLDMTERELANKRGSTVEVSAYYLVANQPTKMDMNVVRAMIAATAQPIICTEADDMYEDINIRRHLGNTESVFKELDDQALPF